MPSRSSTPLPRPGPANPFVPFRKEDVARSIPELFERQVRQGPERLAVKTAATSLTYGALNQAANRLARALLERRGVAEEPVALLLPHGAAAVAAILGILKAGKLYVPLDPSFPAARTADVLKDAGPGLIVTDSAHRAQAELLAGANAIVNLDSLTEGPGADPALPLAPDRAASLLYTSGSTGKPKGVVHSHRNLLHDVMLYTNSLHLGRDDCVSLLAPFAFAAAGADLFPTLLNGATLCPYSIVERGLAELGRWLVEEGITVFHPVPTVFRHLAATLVGTETFPRLRLIRLGGEPVVPHDVELFRKHFACLLAVTLAATETNAIRQLFLDRRTVLKGPRIPVGFALDDKEVVVVDEAGKELGPGEPGEIVVRSPYLACGYWGDPELSRKVFRTDARRKNVRTYRTGDRGMLGPDGCLEHLGRQDAQVKIRGQRVETGEVETALLGLGSIREAVVVGRPLPAVGQQLVAYVVPASPLTPDPSPRSTGARGEGAPSPLAPLGRGAGVEGPASSPLTPDPSPRSTGARGESASSPLTPLGRGAGGEGPASSPLTPDPSPRSTGERGEKATLSVKALRQALKEKLPAYMVPTAFVFLDRLPLTTTGKVDRLALPAPDAARPAVDSPYLPPGNMVQALLKDLWEVCLNVRPIGIRDDFFELGGDSLVGEKVLTFIEKQFAQRFYLGTLLAAPTVEKLAALIVGDSAGEAASPLVQIQAGAPGRRRLFFLNGDLGAAGFYLALARELGAEQPFFVLQPHGLLGWQVPASIEAMAADDLRILRSFQPEGPYLLAGHCVGGLIAFEMARRLVLQGQAVDGVVVIAPPPDMRLALTVPDAAVPGPLLVSAGGTATAPCRRAPALVHDLGRMESGLARLQALGAIHLKACRDYLLRPFCGALVVIQPAEDVQKFGPAIPWKAAAPRVDLHVIPGAHQMTRAEHVQGVVSILRQVLDRH
jgi:amino acid adenylation domain-containing protein